MREYYFYRRGYWEIGVDAISKKDADDYIAVNAMGAKYIGRHIPPRETMATGAITPARQHEIRDSLE